MYLNKVLKLKVYSTAVFMVLWLTIPVLAFEIGDGDLINRSSSAAANEAVRQEALREKLDSKLMKREMDYRVILPKDYVAAKDKRYPVIYLLHGLFGNQNNWSELTKLTTYAQSYDLIIVMPHGANGWYTDSLTKPEDKYESYIVKELIPEVDKKFRTRSERNSRAVAGLSMGGYGAMKFGLKYPELFVLAGSFSGALGAATLDEKTAGESVSRSLDAIFGKAGSDIRKANDIFGLIGNASAEQIKAFPFLYLDCGTEDFLFQNNRDFTALLSDKKVPHEFRQLPGAHNWPYWDKQIQEFLRLSTRYFSQQAMK